VGDRPPRTIFARNLTEIIEPRAQELLVMIRDDLRRAGMERQIQAGFVLTGGGAQLNGFDELAEHVFQCRCGLGSHAGFWICRIGG